MVLTFTISICEILESKILYMLYFTIMDYFQCGLIIIQPKVYINAFGHQNLILIHGLIRFLGVRIPLFDSIFVFYVYFFSIVFQIPSTLIEILITPYLIENFGYAIAFICVNIFSAASKLFITYKIITQCEKIQKLFLYLKVWFAYIPIVLKINGEIAYEFNFGLTVKYRRHVKNN